MIYALLAIASAIIAAGSLYFFQHDGNTWLLVVAVVFVILTVVSGIVFMSSRINKTEDIHITE